MYLQSCFVEPKVKQVKHIHTGTERNIIVKNDRRHYCPFCPQQTLLTSSSISKNVLEYFCFFVLPLWIFESWEQTRAVPFQLHTCCCGFSIFMDCDQSGNYSVIRSLDCKLLQVEIISLANFYWSVP